ncbi:MAG: nicotinamidase-like amidase [Herbinix sp.]|jgi:nicotinamidase-related amidase|nr:nicotinamidase-like amidase [Herbinix sp.]
MKDTILLVVDVQTALIEEHPYNETKVIKNIKQLIHTSRQAGIEVVYVRHDGGVGGDLEINTKGWQIYHEIAPESGEMIFDKKYCSSFLKTGLKEYIDNKEIKTIILVGMQTEYCIDTTCKTAFEHGYKVIIPKETNTTFDNAYLTSEKLYEFYNYMIWDNRFGQLISVDDLEIELQRG